MFRVELVERREVERVLRWRDKSGDGEDVEIVAAPVAIDLSSALPVY